MEEYYQKEKRTENHLDSESQLYYKKEMSFEDKENIFKEIYSNIDLFNRLARDSEKYIDYRNNLIKSPKNPDFS